MSNHSKQTPAAPHSTLTERLRSAYQRHAIERSVVTAVLAVAVGMLVTIPYDRAVDGSGQEAAWKLLSMVCAFVAAVHVGMLFAAALRDAGPLADAWAARAKSRRD